RARLLEAIAAIGGAVEIGGENGAILVNPFQSVNAAIVLSFLKRLLAAKLQAFQVVGDKLFSNCVRRFDEGAQIGRYAASKAAGYLAPKRHLLLRQKR